MSLAKAYGTAPVLEANPDAITTIASTFLLAWDRAWANRDAAGPVRTSHIKCSHVNRFGTLLVGILATGKALSFLHSKEGPFGLSSFPPLKLLQSRRVAPDVVIANTGWENPVIRPDGKFSETEWIDMIVTFVLVREGDHWKASEVDAHNVEKMNLPFSHENQKL